MFKLRLLLVLLLSLPAVNALSAVFVVTSNADSGPGTLREALTLTLNNNLPGIDYIHFNMADQSEAGRTIKLLTELPAVSSDLVIDGTTQPGNKWGVSDARIKIETPQNTAAFTVFNLPGSHNVAFYGLFIYDYTSSLSIIPGLRNRYGINLTNASNITIGTVSKGNVIRGFATNTIFGKASSVINIGSNLIGLDAAQSDYSNFSGPLALINCDKITIGGDLNNNVIFCRVFIGMTDLVKTHNIDINANNWCVFKDGKSFDADFQLPGLLRIYTEQSSTPGPAISAIAVVNIKDNVAANIGTPFSIEQLKGLVTFQRNHIGIANDETTILSGNNAVANTGAGIRIEFSPAQIIIGGESLADKNYFAFMNTAVYAGFSSYVFVRNNEYQCIKESAYINMLPKTIPPVQIVSVTTDAGNTILSGIAEAGAIIDIYSPEACVNSACSIRRLAESVIADDNGNWESTLVGLSGNFYVSATVGLKTSTIKTFEVNVDNMERTFSSCTGIFNITGLAVPGGLSYYWEDVNGNFITSNIDLHVSEPGTYRFVLGDGCVKSEFQLDQQTATQFPAYPTKIVAACPGQANGSITITVNNLVQSALWKDQQGNDIGTGAVLSNIGPGTYNLYLTDRGGCQSFYKDYTIAPVAPLQIVQGAEQITNDECNLKTGSIKNIQVTGGTPPYKYSWTNAQNTVFSTDKDVQGLIAGNYTLNISDALGCTLASTTYAIQIQDDIIPPPVVNDVKVCVLGSEVLLVVSNPAAKYTYRLYDTDNSLAPIDIQASGSFKIAPKANRYYYVSQVTGSCESARTTVAVTEGLKINIANAFTPNNDGINDNWKIAGIENALAPTVQLFNRNGQKVFESRGYAQPFDGTMNGKALPVGTYYYIINLSSNCKLLSGGVTIIR